MPDLVSIFNMFARLLEAVCFLFSLFYFISYLFLTWIQANRVTWIFKGKGCQKMKKKTLGRDETKCIIFIYFLCAIHILFMAIERRKVCH